MSADPPATTPPSRTPRHSLDATRDSITHKFQIMGHEGYLTVGLFENGMPGELFVKMAKEGSTLSGLMQAFCRAFSLALQYGLPLEEACTRFRDMRFEPMGPTGNPDVPEAKSIIDYVARYLEVEFVQKRR
jgi:ribonucleoside-diphosphate reductase alpha chain